MNLWQRLGEIATHSLSHSAASPLTGQMHFVLLSPHPTLSCPYFLACFPASTLEPATSSSSVWPFNARPHLSEWRDSRASVPWEEGHNPSLQHVILPGTLPNSQFMCFAPKMRRIFNSESPCGASSGRGGNKASDFQEEDCG